MSITKKLVKAIQRLYRQILKLSRAMTKAVMQWLLRSFLVMGRGAKLSRSGFILPTVTMVILVVVLLTTAIVFRSFDRAKNASNYRVNQAVLNAAQPAIDRAKAKLQALFEDPNLPRGTPSEVSLNDVLKRTKYNLPDETRLRLAYNFGNGLGGGADGTIQVEGTADALSNAETTSTVWRFPVDTDNNGKFDSISLYAIEFRNPTVGPNGDFTRNRSPLEARTPPMDDSATRPGCDALGTSASLVGSDGWYKVSGKLKKSFFVYVATVPIDNINDANVVPAAQISNYENYKGNKGFSALEYQQDLERIPLSNNAVVYNDDLEMASGTQFRVNGRIFTNSNLLIKELDGAPVELFQVSSRESCFYEADNSKIVVGGNFGYGVTNDSTTPTSNAIDVHLFQGTKNTTDPVTNQSLNTGNQSVTNTTNNIAYNGAEYERRINYLVTQTIATNTFTATGTAPNITISTNDPAVVKNKVLDLVNNTTNPIPPSDARGQVLELYFRNRTRQVPYGEVPLASTGTATFGASEKPQGLGTDKLRPPDKWIFPFDPTDGKTQTNFASLTLKISSQIVQPPATKFELQEKDEQERSIGDRVLVGNNLPALWYKDSDNDFVGSKVSQDIAGTKWNYPSGDSPSARRTRVRTLDNLDTIDRDGYWETQSAEQPINYLDPVGGLRIVTGAGVYLPPTDTDGTNTSLTTAPTTASNVVWPDTMPVIPPHAITPPTWLGAFPADQSATPLPRPFLKMRATAVYHYTNGGGKTPIACVATYYDPTTRDTARNYTGLADVSYDLIGVSPVGTQPTRPAAPSADQNYSINGITFGPPIATIASVRNYLNYQANLVYPNGRPVNQNLKDALVAVDASKPLTLAQKGAIDSTICALQIYGKTKPTPNTSTWGDIGAATETPKANYKLPHGTIRETAFLDARQIKSIDNGYNPAATPAPVPVVPSSTASYPPPAAGSSSLTGRYDLPIEERYPLEIRATVIDLNNLRTNTAPAFFPGVNEYMLPNSGIIYATRDDGLPDLSDTTTKLSATDFNLDPTRRPNGIMLINGSELGRRTTFDEVEKGLTLVSNLPVYVKGEFNPHKSGGAVVGEFTGTQPNNSTPAATFYSRSTKDVNFACRKGDSRLPGCTTGDTWRAATILSDAVTLLSSNFREGVRTEGDYDLRNNQIDNVANADGDATTGVTGTGADINTAAVIRTNRLQNGFLNNNFATNGLSGGKFFAQNSIRTNLPSVAVTLTDGVYSTQTDPNFANAVNSSYFNNLVTPVQRRGNFSEYVMEYCPRVLVSECGATDWKITSSSHLTNPSLDSTNAVGKPATVLRTGTVPGAVTNPPLTAVAQSAGTTATSPAVGLERYPRRIAFLRNNTGNLILQNGRPIPLGINSGTINCYTYPSTGTYTNVSPSFTCPAFDDTTSVSSANRPTAVFHSLWYRTEQSSNADYGYQYSLDYIKTALAPPLYSGTPPSGSSVGTTNQPILIPVLQLQYTDGNPDTINPASTFNALGLGTAGTTTTPGKTHARYTNWLPRATTGTTIYNAVFGTGDSPSRPSPTFTPALTHDGDFNGGLPNIVRFMENWDWSPSGSTTPSATTQISGSFIQIRRSQYATAPYFTLPNQTGATGGIFNSPQLYSNQNSSGKVSYFQPPGRQWGFDVGLLSQIPDLFARQFTLEPTEKPNEFFREVGRDDEWVKTLLCARTFDKNNLRDKGFPAVNADQRPHSFCVDKTDVY